MNVDLLIKKGYVIDPCAGVSAVKNIAVRDGLMVDTEGASFEGAVQVDAAGCYIFPGLIDFHTHLFEGGSGFGINPDLLLATGVTTAVDAGSVGCANFEAFYRAVCVHRQLRIKAFLHLSPVGQVGYGIQEQADPKTWDLNAISRLVRDYSDTIIGLKLRIGKAMLGDRGIEPLVAAAHFAQQMGLPLSVHVTDSTLSAAEIARALPGGSIFCHVYHGKGNTIVNADGVYPEIQEAATRGVLFDAANGKTNFDFGVAKQAMAHGFYPDIISTDITPSTLNIGRDVKSLPHLMSKYMAMGMPLPDVVTRVTKIPAQIMGMAGKIGTLRPDAYADITICRLLEGDFIFEDANAKTLQGKKLLVPVATVDKGKVVFCQTDFAIYR